MALKSSSFIDKRFLSFLVTNLVALNVFFANGNKKHSHKGTVIYAPTLGLMNIFTVVDFSAESALFHANVLIVIINMPHQQFSKRDSGTTGSS